MDLPAAGFAAVATGASTVVAAAAWDVASLGTNEAVDIVFELMPAVFCLSVASCGASVACTDAESAKHASAMNSSRIIVVNV